MRQASRALLLALGLVCLPGVAWATIPAHVGASAFTATVGATCTISYTPTPGNTVLVGVIQIGANSGRTYAVSDGSNTYTSAHSATGNSNRWLEVFFAISVISAGDIVVTQSGGASSYFCIVVEITEAQNKGQFDDEVSTIGDNHAASASGITTQPDCYVFVLGVYTASPGTSQTAGSGYTALTTANLQYFAQYRASSSVLTSNTGEWTSATTDRVSMGLMVEFYDTPTSGGAPKGMLMRVF